MPYLNLPSDLNLFYKIDDYSDPWVRPQTVLFVHGANENTKAWRAWVPHLSRDYRLIRIDQRGFGKSGAVPAGFQFTTELFVDDLVRVINSLVAEPVHVVAAKSGGISAINLAAMRPDLVRTITLLSTPVSYSKTGGSIELMEKQGMRAWARSTMRARLGKSMPEQGIDWWVDLMGSTSILTMQAYLRWVCTIDLRDQLAQIKCPALVITSATSSRDKSDLEVYEKNLSKLELAAIPVDGYHPSGADPDSCARTTLGFLERCARR